MHRPSTAMTISDPCAPPPPRENVANSARGTDKCAINARKSATVNRVGNLFFLAARSKGRNTYIPAAPEIATAVIGTETAIRMNSLGINVQLGDDIIVPAQHGTGNTIE